MNDIFIKTDGELYHYGIKGMRWGVRRFQKKNGSLTPAGKKRYSDSESKKTHRQKLEEAYVKQGLSQKEAQKAANGRIKTEKILATTAGIAVTAYVAYTGGKAYRNRVDGLIKAGETLKRVEMQDTGGKLHDTFYAAKGRHDKKRYEGMLGMTRKLQTGKAYVMDLQANSDIKVASKKNAIKVFEDLYKNDDSFRDSVKVYVERHPNGKNVVKNIYDTRPKNMRKMYENFNSELVSMRNSPTRPDKQFYSKLKKSGYGAIQDINDMKFSGYNARNPLIVFDNTNKSIAVKSVREMGYKEASKKYTVELLKKVGEDTLPKAAAVSSVAAVSTYNQKPENEKR